MGKIQEYLVTLARIKGALKTSIQGKGVVVSNDAVFSDYPGLIDQIPTLGDESAFAIITEKNLRTIPSVPAGITYIPDETFLDYSSLEEINIPSTVSYIGKKAFYNSGLTSITITGGTRLNIREKAFSECPELQSIHIKGTSVILSEDAFSNSLTSNLTEIRIEGLQGKIRSTDLIAIKNLYDGGTLGGIDGNGNHQTLPALIGTLTLTDKTDQFSTLQTFFSTCGLTLVECQYSDYWFDDREFDPYNITNEDNRTGYYYNNTYLHSGHIDVIREQSCPCSGVINSTTHKMHVTKLSKTNLSETASGEAFDLTDAGGAGYDIFIYVPHYWYKGVNDHKNEKKHFFLSSTPDTPQSSGTALRTNTTNLLWKTGKAISNVKVGDDIAGVTLETDTDLSIYRVDVSGFAQVRFPGYEHDTRGSVFTDENGIVLETYIFKQKSQGAANLGDFDNTLGDYIFLEIPQEAKYLYFNCLTAATTGTQVILTNSYELEAIEPDWVEHKGELVGVYQGYAEGVNKGGIATSGLRSLSGKLVSRGDGSTGTNSEWAYNTANNPTGLPTTTLKGSCGDFLNLARYRNTETGVLNGEYHSISYESQKDLANLILAWFGTRDVETIVGRGTNSSTNSYTSGTRNSIPFGDTSYPAANQNNKIWGLECWTGTFTEWEDRVCYNYESFASFLANHWPTAWSGHTYDSTYRIVQQDGTERNVKARHLAAAAASSKTVARVRFGRYCDLVVSSWADIDTGFCTCYAAGQLTSTSMARVVIRSGNSALANAGVVFSYTYYGSSLSLTYCGSRLCFLGEIENESELSE